MWRIFGAQAGLGTRIQRRGRWVSDVWKIYVQGTSDEEMNMTERRSKNATNLNGLRR